MTVRIITICTGNICRSPYAHLLLAHRLGQVRPGAFEVSSAGVYALIGEGVDPGSAVHLDRHGIAHDDFAARQLTEPILSDVDLLLAMSSEHRKHVLEMYAPSMLKRAYTLKEMARLIESAGEATPWTERLAGLKTPEERWRAIPVHLAAERRRVRLDPALDDLADPYRRPQEVFDTMAAEVEAAVETIVGLEAAS